MSEGTAPITIDSLLNTAVDLHRQGRLAEADTLYNAVLAQDSDNPDALHLSGLVARHGGDPARALALLTRAVDRRPGFVAALFNLGNFLQSRGRPDEALIRFREAVAAQPDYIDARINAAAVLMAQGRAAEATRQYRTVLALIPEHPDAQANLGLALRLTGPDQALVVYRRALLLRPGMPTVLSNMGALLKDLGNDGAAVRVLHRAIAVDPGCAVGYGNLGAIDYSRGDFDIAEQGYRRSLQLLADNPELWGNLGTASQFIGRMAPSLAAHRLSIALAPADPEAYNRLGIAEQCCGHATVAFDRCLILDPAKRVARWHRSLARLGVGDLAGGWADYEDGLASGQRYFLSELPIPLWQGESLAGRTILIRREQGIGDELMFNACLLDLERLGALCVLECSPRLKTLFQRSFPNAIAVETDGLPAVLDRLTAEGRAPAYQVGLASLPYYFRVDLADFPMDPGGHLRPDPERVAAWRRRIDAAIPDARPLRIGFGWRSRRVYGKDYHLYSQDLRDWQAIFRVPGTVFVSLQYDPSEEELDAARALAGPDARIVSFPELDLTNDLDNAAALTAACDLVISTASAVAVMGAAVGRPTWLMTLPADWRTHATPHYPWLPSSTCLVRDWEEDWRPILQTVAERLQALAPIGPVQSGLSSRDGTVPGGPC